jgi:hypothetical protein
LLGALCRAATSNTAARLRLSQQQSSKTDGNVPRASDMRILVRRITSVGGRYAAQLRQPGRMNSILLCEFGASSQACYRPILERAWP